ncbi:MAG: Rid family detoxifying hydrolase [Thauera sp.]|jgi:2-iminobutanoate/2-iminopropanoate deaminase
MQIISTKEAPQAIGPYSQAIVSGDWVHTSGQIPLDAAGQKVAGGIEEQTEQVFDNLEAVLRAAGASLTGVVSVTVFMADLAEFAAMNAIFARRFGEHRPARSTVQVAALPIGARVEIAAIARIGA